MYARYARLMLLLVILTAACTPRIVKTRISFPGEYLPKSATLQITCETGAECDIGYIKRELPLLDRVFGKTDEVMYDRLRIKRFFLAVYVKSRDAFNMMLRTHAAASAPDNGLLQRGVNTLSLPRFSKKNGEQSANNAWQGYIMAAYYEKNGRYPTELEIRDIKSAVQRKFRQESYVFNAKER